MRARLARQWRAFLAAVEFLTRIPVVRTHEFVPDDLPRSTPYFPVVGLIVGLGGGVVYTAGSAIWPTSIAVVLSVAATVRLTGAFHEDAVADLFDGFGGGWTREQIFAIMKDSRVGAYGAIGLMLVVIAKLLALVVIANATIDVGILNRGVTMTRVMIAAHVLGRWSSLPLIWRYPYVRPETPDERQGTGKPFASSVTTGRFTVGTVITLAIVLLAIPARSLAAIAVAAVVTLMCGRYFHRRIGGITGDTLGGTNQFVELATYLVVAASPHWT
jgi:adenosylcobinamide-GDP ribazoletransferase